MRTAARILEPQHLAQRYIAAYEQHFAPFPAANGHILEHYLVNCVYRGPFPFEPQESTSTLSAQQGGLSIHDHFMLMATHYAIIETLLVGLAGLYKATFAGHVIRVIYTSTRTFEHSLNSAPRVLTKSSKRKRSQQRPRRGRLSQDVKASPVRPFGVLRRN
jgi:hypothetical protein